MIRLLEIRYASLLSYCPRDSSEKGEIAKRVMRAIKNESPVSSKFGELFASEFIAKTLKEIIDKDENFKDFLGENPVLIPVPRHSPIKKYSLWPSLQIAKAMEREGIGTVRPILERIEAVPRSSMSSPESRPSPTTHYKSMAIKRIPTISRDVILVDDLVTRGHTFIASAWHVCETFPDVEVRAFAAMRTVSNRLEFKELFDPVIGRITYRPEYDDCLRRPS